MKFIKVQATGNDFVVLDAFQGKQDWPGKCAGVASESALMD